MSDGADTSIAPAAGASGAPTILQVLPSLVTGGVERGTVDIAQALGDAGWGAVVASSGGPMVRAVERAGAVHVELPVHSKNPFVMRSNVERLAEVIRRHGVDIVHARSRAPAISARAAARHAGVGFVTTFHGTYNIGLAPKRWYNRVMTTGDRVIAISEFIAEHMVAEYKSDRSRIRVIHRGIDTELFDPAKVSDERMIKLAADWRLPDGVPIVMLPGRLTRWKGQRVLIEAVARLDNARLRCLIVGDDQGRTGYRREIEGLIQDRGLEGTVHLMGDCPDMPAAYKLADVVVSASTDPEAFGRIMVEAQAMGTPVIASDHGASRELLLEDETGWLFPPGDAAALAERVEAAIGLDSARRERIAERAMANARAKFSKEGMCAATLEVYREVIAKTAADAGPVAA